MPTQTRPKTARRKRPAARKPAPMPVRGAPVRATMLQKSQVAFFELDIRIAAAPDRVWRALTEEIGHWWLPDFYCAPNSKAIKLEPWPGGRLYEDAENGGGLLWFNVVAVTPPESLHLAGHIIPPYGGPATTLLHLSLSRIPSGTLLKVHNSVLGYISKGQLESTIAGWRQLFAEGLKPYAQSAEESR